MLKLTKEMFSEGRFVDVPVWIAPQFIVTVAPAPSGGVVWTQNGAIEVRETPEVVVAMIQAARDAESLSAHERVMEAMALLEADEDESGETRQ